MVAETIRADAVMDGGGTISAGPIPQAKPHAPVGSPGAGGQPNGQQGTQPKAPEKTPLTDAEMQARAAAAARISSAFGDIIALLMGSAQFKHYALTDLEWLVVPPLASGQFLLAHAQSRETGLTAPAAVILWASVSEEVDQRLAATIDHPLRLKPHEWKSGDILWIIAAAGEPRAVMAVLEQQRQAGFKGRQIKFRLQDEKGARVEVVPSVSATPAASGTA